MFTRFYKARKNYVVRDSYTHNIIATGTEQECSDYRDAFGLAYVEPA